MNRLQDRSFASATQPLVTSWGGLGCVVLALCVGSCRSISVGRLDTLPAEEAAVGPRFSIVFVIHGDGNYLYHDSRGRAHKADEEALSGAARVAARNPQAEVFVFHQIPRRRTLFLFPRRDGRVYYYRHGRLLANESYRRNQGASRFEPEVELYRRFRAEYQPHVANVFLYFGHEIPEFRGIGYDRSASDRAFVVDDLADFLRRIIGSSTKFDLVVLSTCFGGAPRTIAALSPIARTIVASPENLHLSYFDLQPFEGLEARLRDGTVPGFAKHLARESFDRLTDAVQTAVTVAIYDGERVRGYLDSVAGAYDAALATLQGQRSESLERYDCAEDSTYVRPGMNEGVEVFYRPSRFGRSKQKRSHSGWECSRGLTKRTIVSTIARR